MDAFPRRDGILYCEQVSLLEIAREAGTPVHVYSAGAIDARYRALDTAFSSYPHRLHYALKANSTLGVAARLQQLGAGADVNSGGELEVALRAGFGPADIVFTGVGKTRGELDRAVSLGVAAINVESGGEARRVAEIAAALGTRARLALRINPDVDAGSHPKISTGLRITKFGMPPEDAVQLFDAMRGRPHVTILGLHVHVGSQITTADPLRHAAHRLVEIAQAVRARGATLDHLDLGGGLGLAYEPGRQALSPDEYAAALLPIVRTTGLRLVLEPGRWILGPAGALVTAVIDIKGDRAPAPSPDDLPPVSSTFVVTDAGMTDLLRPALYGAWHAIDPVVIRPGPVVHADVVGPVCETSDTLGRDRILPPVEVDDLLAVRDTGAYGAVMASNYNRRPIAAEVMVDGARWRIVRRRQTIDDLLQWDV
jgi:diaminopimelate decarboxylase